MFPQPDVPSALYSVRSMFPQPYVPSVRCSLSPIFRQFDVPSALCSVSSMFPQPYVPSVRCSFSSMFRRPKPSVSGDAFYTYTRAQSHVGTTCTHAPAQIRMNQTRGDLRWIATKYFNCSRSSPSPWSVRVQNIESREHLAEGTSGLGNKVLRKHRAYGTSGC